MKARTLIMEGLPILSDLKLLQGIENGLKEVLQDFRPDAIALVPETPYAFIRVRTLQFNALHLDFYSDLFVSHSWLMMG